MFKTAAANKHLNETTEVVGKFQISEPNLRFVEGTEAMHKSIPPAALSSNPQFELSTS